MIGTDGAHGVFVWAAIVCQFGVSRRCVNYGNNRSQCQYCMGIIMSPGDRIKEERERLGYNQADFSALAGATRKSQFNYETGERSPDIRYLIAISSVGADIQYIVTGIRSTQALAPDELQLVAAFRAAPLAVKGAVIGALAGWSRLPAVTVGGDGAGDS